MLSVEVTPKDEAYPVGQIVRQTFSISNISQPAIAHRVPGRYILFLIFTIFISVFEAFTNSKCDGHTSNLPGTPWQGVNNLPHINQSFQPSSPQLSPLENRQRAELDPV